jgi:hypothetical protein
MVTCSGFTETFSRHEATPMIGSTIVIPEVQVLEILGLVGCAEHVRVGE